ncbi:MAG: substrate-binding domain-containing protein [Pseudomonadota bacterium]|nr:substrate-binding domain-containing protein [Pseudomonadota bacterium]
MRFFLLTIIFFIFCQKIVYVKEFIILQSTTSTRDSGLYDHLLPQFSKKFGFDVRVIAVGTGQAIKNARKCDADVLIVHHQKSEEQFVEDGFGLFRKEFMFNDYVLVGPSSDPALISKSSSIKNALDRILKTQSFFVSRGDDSGTNKKEIGLWEAIGEVPDPRHNKWYLSVGQGMGGALNIAVNKDAYIISDRATWMSFKNKREHKVLVSNEPLLYNYYGVIPINPDKCPNTKSDLASTFVEWLVSKKTKELIDNFKVNREQLFFSTRKMIEQGR